MKKWLIGGIIFLVVLIVAGSCAVSTGAGTYNTAIEKRNNTREAWSQVENVYQRRMDLIPNLVETVKGYAAHEQATFENVAEARASVGQIEIDPSNATPQQMLAFQQAQGELSSALSRLMVVQEDYPELQANENFMALQDQLEGTENRIAVERRRYNEVATEYNTYIQKFPTNIIIGILGNISSEDLSEMAVFQAQEGADEAPEVDFSNDQEGS